MNLEFPPCFGVGVSAHVCMHVWMYVCVCTQAHVYTCILFYGFVFYLTVTFRALCWGLNPGRASYLLYKDPTTELHYRPSVPICVSERFPFPSSTRHHAYETNKRSIGSILGHYLDQKRLKQGLYRHPWDDISYVLPEHMSM